MNKAASDEIIWHCKHYTGRGVMKFYESGEALCKDMNIPLSTLEADPPILSGQLLKAFRKPGNSVRCSMKSRALNKVAPVMRSMIKCIQMHVHIYIYIDK